MTEPDPDGTESGIDADPDDRKAGTFLVTHAESDSAVLKDVEGGQVHTLSSNPGLDRHDAVEGVLAPDPPLEVTWQLVEVEERRPLTLEESEEPPTRQERELADAQAVGELTTEERAGTGELHVLTVPEAETASAVADVLGDEEATLARAARLGVARVEVRSAPGVVAVRYLP